MGNGIEWAIDQFCARPTETAKVENLHGKKYRSKMPKDKHGIQDEQLYNCPICHCVWERYQNSEGKKIQNYYTDFPKIGLSKKTCTSCMEDIENYYETTR